MLIHIRLHPHNSKCRESYAGIAHAEDSRPVRAVSILIVLVGLRQLSSRPRNRACPTLPILPGVGTARDNDKTNAGKAAENDSLKGVLLVKDKPHTVYVPRRLDSA